MNKPAAARKLSRGLRLIFTCGLLAVLALLLAPAMVTHAAIIQVTTTNDTGAGSLRQAIADAGSGDEITFADTVTGTITLTSGELSINKNLTITGPGAHVLTISGSNASRVFSISHGVEVTISGLTIANCDIPFAGGIFSNGLLKVKNTIIAGNSAQTAPDCGGTLTSYGCNLIEDTSGCTITGNETGNIYGEDPLLGPLQDNGGPTFTDALLEGSPAIDGVSTECGCTTIDGAPVTSDQRGEPRPADGDGDGTALCDIGAYELQPLPSPNSPPIADAGPD